MTELTLSAAAPDAAAVSMPGASRRSPAVFLRARIGLVVRSALFLALAKLGTIDCGAGPEPSATEGVAIPGVTLNSISKGLALLEDGFSLNMEVEKGRKRWMWQAQTREGVRYLTVYGRTEAEILSVNALYINRRGGDTNREALPFLQLVATLGSRGKGADLAKRWVSEKLGSGADTRIGALRLKLATGGPNARGLTIISSADRVAAGGPETIREDTLAAIPPQLRAEMSEEAILKFQRQRDRALKDLARDISDIINGDSP